MADDPVVPLDHIHGFLSAIGFFFALFVSTFLALGSEIPIRLMIVGSLPAVAGLCYLYYQRRSVRALEQRAEQITGTVVTADRGTAKVYGYSDHVCYPEITIEYSYDNTRYQTSSFFPFDPTTRYTPDGIDDVLQEYQVDSEGTVFVDPEDPAEAYMQSHPGWQLERVFLGMYWLPVVVVGAGIAFRLVTG
jgi:hypothetical protein